MAATADDRYGHNAPDWKQKPWDETRTLFQVLGVSEDTTQEEIDGAFNRHFERAGAKLGKLPPGVHYAWSFLRVDSKRHYYRQRLHECRNEESVVVPAEGRAAFLNFCEQARIRWWADPVAGGVYHLRIPGQKPPDFVAEALRQEEERNRQDELLLERKKQKRLDHRYAVRKFFLRLGYAFGCLLFVGLALRWSFDGTFSRWLRVVGVVESREDKQLARDSREALALAIDAVLRLDGALDSLHETVKQELNASLGDKAVLPGDLNSTIDKEPTVATAWNSIKEAYLARTELEKRRPSLAAAAGRVDNNAFLRADVETLKDIKTWATRAFLTVGDQKQHIEHIRAMLEAERFDRAAEQPAKES